jgi:TDG/mug DNA glycosylase family protein
VVLRPTKEQLAAAHGRTIKDVIAPGLRVLFCGINPSLYSAATGWHFARPGNRFWPALHAGGFTPRLLHPSEQETLAELGLGITNVVGRATARADELTGHELREGGKMLAGKVAAFRPQWLAVVGITAYRTAFDAPKGKIGRQAARIGGAAVWVLPNPSGLNAQWTPVALAAEFSRLHKTATHPG